MSAQVSARLGRAAHGVTAAAGRHESNTVAGKLPSLVAFDKDGTLVSYRSADHIVGGVPLFIMATCDT